MVPDAAVVVMPLDAGPRLWATIVVEVANSQGYDDVLAKVKCRFRNSHGMGYFGSRSALELIMPRFDITGSNSCIDLHVVPS